MCLDVNYKLLILCITSEYLYIFCTRCQEPKHLSVSYFDKLERDHQLKDWQKQHLAHIFINICLYSEMKIPTWSLDNLLFMVQKSHIKTQY